MELTIGPDREDKSHTTTLWLKEPYNGPHARLYSSPSYRHFGLSLTVGGEQRDLTIAGGFGFYLVLSLHFHPWSFRHWTHAWAGRRAEANKARNLGSTWAHELDPMDGRETGIRIHDGSIWWNLWHNDHCWSQEDKRVWPWEGNGWTWTWHVWDWLVGSADYHQDSGTWHSVEQEIGGVAYPFRVHLYPCRWSRRWPWRGRQMYRFCISLRGHDSHDPEPGEPHNPPMRAGKGENSYDCEPDGTFAMTGAARRTPYTVAEAVAAYVESYERDLKRYGAA